MHFVFPRKRPFSPKLLSSGFAIFMNCAWPGHPGANSNISKFWQGNELAKKFHIFALYATK